MHSDASSPRDRVRDTTDDAARASFARTFQNLDLAALGWSRAVRGAPPELLSRHAHAVPARVVRVDRGGSLLVAPGTGDLVRLHDHCGADDPCVVGDWVLIDAGEPGAGAAANAGALSRACGRIPRTGVLARRRGESSTAPQALAANVDLVLIVEALTGRRGANAGRIARMKALAMADGIDTHVVMTHGDQAGDDCPLGAGDIVTSIVDGRGLDELRELFATGVTGVLVGASGAGKSSLVNALLGEELRATAARRASGFGRHTTSAGQLMPLPGGGMVIDTPGVRLLGMHADVDVDSLRPPELEALAAACRFTDCSHDVEPGCAVTEAIARGELPADAVTSWRRLEREALRERARSDARLRRELGAGMAALTREVERARRRGEIRQRR